MIIMHAVVDLSIEFRRACLSRCTTKFRAVPMAISAGAAGRSVYRRHFAAREAKCRIHGDGFRILPQYLRAADDIGQAVMNVYAPSEDTVPAPYISPFILQSAAHHGYFTPASTFISASGHRRWYAWRAG